MFSETKEAWLAFCLLNTSVNQAINPELWNGTLKRMRTFFTQSKILIPVTNTLTSGIRQTRHGKKPRTPGSLINGMPHLAYLGADVGERRGICHWNLPWGGWYSVGVVPFYSNGTHIIFCRVKLWGICKGYVGGCSLVPRPLPDFISQPWRKIGEGLGSKLRHGPEMVDSVVQTESTLHTNRVHHFRSVT